MKIKEIIVVEGRDDTAAINKAVEAQTIETHGWGINEQIWELIDNAYKNSDIGIIIFTDPDYAGGEIRRRVKERCPNAKEAFLSREDATCKGDVGIENAKPEAIREALEKAHCTSCEGSGLFNKQDLVEAKLTGLDGASRRREDLGKALGIGSGNANAFLKKLNYFGITKEEYHEALRNIHD